MMQEPNKKKPGLCIHVLIPTRPPTKYRAYEIFFEEAETVCFNVHFSCRLLQEHPKHIHGFM